MATDYKCEGSCRCGAVRMRVSAYPMFTSACHCSGCRKMSASAYSLSAAFAAEAFVVIAGDPAIGGTRGATRHYFCPSCYSWMFTRPDGFDFMVNVRATLLDDLRWAAPFIETFTSVKLPFAETGARRSYAEFPDEQAFGPLLAEFARGVQER